MKKKVPLRMRVGCALGLLLISSILLAGQAWAKSKTSYEMYRLVKTLENRVAELEHKIGVQQDIEEIRTIMYSYAYYMDRSLFDQVLDLFSENAESCEAGGRGVYLGKEGCTTLWKKIWGVYGGAQNKHHWGSMLEHNISKLVITVSPDRTTAKSRGNFFSFAGVYNRPEASTMQMGIYNLEYVKEDGVWKISKWWIPFTTTGYNFSTWATNPGYSGCGSEEYPPDLPTTNYHPFPEVYVVPFHYPNPVTGNEIPQNGYTDPKHYWIGNWPDEWGQCGRIEPQTAAQ